MESLPESSVAKRIQTHKILWNFWFIWKEECWVRQISPEHSEVFWAAALYICRSAVHIPHSEGGFGEPVAYFVAFKPVEFTEQPQSKHANLTSQGNTSSVFLWRIKGVVGFPPQLFEDILIISEVGKSWLSHALALCLCCEMHFVPCWEQR